MQLLDSTCKRLRDVLQDICTQVQIKSDFCISHPKYKSIQPPLEVVNRLQQLPIERQHHYLSLQVRNFLYKIYYNDSQEKAFETDVNSAITSNIEDNIVRQQYLKFYQQVHKSNCGQGYFDPNWRVLRQESNGNVTVQKNCLTLQVECGHLQLAPAFVGDTVSVRMPRNLIEPGFYIAVGDAGLPWHHSANVYIYFNVSSEGAIALMKSISQQLNKIYIPFTFKVLANLSEYRRYDSGVLYIERDNYKVIQPILQSICAENQQHFQVQVPVFMKQLMPGLGLAEEPKSKFTAKEDFGMNRCQIVANSLIAAWQQENESTQSKIASIYQHFSLAGFSLQYPYLNTNSEDIYTCWN